MQTFHLHLVSDSTGETASSVSRAALSQFEDVEPIEHIWSLVRTNTQLEKVIAGIREDPGIVIMTLVEKEHRQKLQQTCDILGIPCIHVLEGVLSAIGNYLGKKVAYEPGRQHKMDEEYFSRVEAINFALAHDDGQSHWDLEEADIILIGVSRTSKSPTCMYLAFRGYKAANIPFVPGCDMPPNIGELKHPFIVGLTISKDRLIQIRRNRLMTLTQETETEYTDNEQVLNELAEAKKLFARYKWPVIDVTRRSVEETAAHVLKLKKKQGK